MNISNKRREREYGLVPCMTKHDLAKNYQIKKNIFASNEVSTYSGCCRILLLYDVCDGGLYFIYGGLNETTIHQYLRNVCRKIALPKSFNFANSKEPNSHSFWATGLILVPKEAVSCELQSYKEFFYNYRILKKITPSRFSVF